MKIYGTTESDRATKGQGGNRFVRTVFTIEHDNKEREEVATTEVVRTGEEYIVRHIPVNGDATTHRVPIRKR